MCLAGSSRALPAGERLTERVVRLNSEVPSSASRARIVRLRGGWAMPRRSAARPKWSSSATATKARICCSSMVDLPDSSQWVARASGRGSYSQAGCLKQIIAHNVNNSGRILRKRNLLSSPGAVDDGAKGDRRPLPSYPVHGRVRDSRSARSPRRLGVDQVCAAADAHELRPKCRTELDSSHFRILSQQTEWMM